MRNQVRDRSNMLKGLPTAISVAAAGLAAALLYGNYRWNIFTRELRARLDAARMPIRPQRVDFDELESLSPPVQRYFRTALKEAQPMASGVRIRHKGTFNTGESTANWKPFT